jgi:KDO2-lipid IV(A) lauroyltransferase
VLRDRVVYWLFRLTILVTRPFPLRLGYAVAGHVAVFCRAVLFPRHRRALDANLAHVLGTGDRRRIGAVARQGFRNFGKYVIDVIHFPLITREEVRRRLRFDQWDELNAAAADPRGKIIVTVHMGNWDLGAAALAAYDYSVNAIADTFRYEPMNELVQGSRERLGMKVIGHHRVGPRVFRLLRRGEILAMLIDVTSDDAAIWVEFFGRPAQVSSAPARIALRTGAWVLPAVVTRGPDDLDISAELDFSLRDFTPTGDEERDVHELTRRSLAALERMMRPHLDQWFIFKPLWQTGGPAPSPASGRVREAPE